MAPLRQYHNHPDPMDLWLESRGYYRKLTARDGSSLFRAISEQIFCTQRYHQEVRQECVDYLTEHKEFFMNFDLEESIEEYLEHLQNPTQWGGPIEVAVFAIMYKINVLVFKEVGVQPQHEQFEESAKTVMLCYSQDHHYDSVYHKDYTKVAGFCQSLIYEVLYKDVFMMKDVSYAVEKMLHCKPLRHRSDLGLCSPRKFLNFNSSSAQFERKGMEDVPDCAVNVRELLNKGITPFPYKVAKSLDPNIFRNVEFDVWVDYRRGLRFGYFDSGSELRVGVKCLVKLNDGDGYVGHIQEMAADKGPVVLFVEEFGEKRTVPYECLEMLPQEAPAAKQWSPSFQDHRLSSSSAAKQTNSSSELGGKGRKVRDCGESKGSPSKIALGGLARTRNRKLSQCNANCDGIDGNNISSPQGVNLVTYTPPPETYIPSYQVEADLSMPLVVDSGMQIPLVAQSPVSPSTSPVPRHSPFLMPLSPLSPLSPTTDDIAYRYAPLAFSPEGQDTARIASPTPSMSTCPTDYFHFVPYNSPSTGLCDITEQETAPQAFYKDSNFMPTDVWKTQGQINFNAPKSVLESGADLPMSDIVTLRFFYNLGNDVYRAQCFSWNGQVLEPGRSNPGCSASCGAAGFCVPADGSLAPPDTLATASGPRRKRRDTTVTVSSPGGVSMSSESETGDFTPRIHNAAPSPTPTSTQNHVPPRFKKDAKSGGKSKAKDTKREDKAESESFSSKRSREASHGSRLEPLILNESPPKEANDVAMSPLALPYGYVCYPNMPYSPVDTDPNIFFPPCRIQYQDYVADGRPQCFSPVSDFGSHTMFAPSPHFIVPSPPIYVSTPWTVTSPTPQ